MTKTLEQINQEFMSEHGLCDSAVSSQFTAAPFPDKGPDHFDELSLYAAAKDLENLCTAVKNLEKWASEQFPAIKPKPQGFTPADQATIDLFNKKTSDKRKKISRYILFICILVFILDSVLSFSAGTKNKGGIFGFSVYEVLTESMQSEIPKGALILIKDVEPETIRVGDDITFMKDRDTRITHRVTRIIENYDGAGGLGFETKGTENPVPDEQIVDAGDVMGKVVWQIAGSAKTFMFKGFPLHPFNT